MRQALQGWRAGKPPRPVQRLDESKELPPRDLAEGSVTLSKGEVGSVGSSQASPWAVESPLQVPQVERERLLDSGTVSLFALTSDLTNSETVAAPL